jgi:hypothetical protein
MDNAQQAHEVIEHNSSRRLRVTLQKSTFSQILTETQQNELKAP